ncbi:XRE family transcriptional regulator [Acetobacter indonesiensis]|uniref:helix-turn-helix domain-containing protein n=1 Tax=Acetobacter indonesiensis TaxID=104101 RepID=UPI001F27E0D4|nr:XRE family transcriptional regulator [Acetobacter indonesiensis]MCG0996383.1 XRE family transcriptional regulator [Acetobacter indonesiensis]
MSALNEKFVPRRLRTARLARLLLQKELAELVGRSDTTVSKWENDEYSQEPDASIIPKLADVLSVEPQWFFKPTYQTPNASFFRSLKSEDGKLRDKAEARLDFVEEIDQILGEYVEFPTVDVPDLLDGRDFRTLRSDDIEHYAKMLREYWLLGDEPIDDLLLVSENAGIVVAHDEIGSEKLDGVSRWGNNGRPYMLLAQDKHIGVRRRFDAGHELGHILLHRHVSPKELSAHFKLIEEQAMTFAGAFLMPECSFGDDVYSLSLDALLAIKGKWKVSVAGMIKRLSSMKRITPEYERRLWQYYSYRKWRGFEPMDDEIAVEQPHNLKASIELIIEEKLATPADLIRQISLSSSDVSELTGVSKDILEPQFNHIRRMPMIKASQLSELGENIVSFPGGKIRH